MRSRPLAVTIAAILLALFGLLNCASPLLVIYELMPSEAGLASFAYPNVMLGIVTIFSVERLWRLRSGGSVVHHRHLRAQHPGGSAADSLWIRRPTASRCRSSGRSLAIIIVLVVLPASRRAFTTS